MALPICDGRQAKAYIEVPSFLQGDLSKERTMKRCLAKVCTTEEPELFFQMERFFAFLSRNYTSFDVMTYSITRDAHKRLRVNRLITGLPYREAQYVRTASNIHSKLFLCYRRRRLLDAFVGSQNFVHPTTYNIMVRATPSQRKALAVYFDDIWRDLV